MSTKEIFLNIEKERVIPALREAACALDSSSGQTALDFSSVQRIEPGALRALEELAQIAEDKAVKIVLRGVNVDVYKVLKLVKLTHRLTFVN